MRTDWTKPPDSTLSIGLCIASSAVAPKHMIHRTTSGAS